MFYEEIADVITEENAKLLEEGKAHVHIKRTGNKDQLGLYVEDQLVYKTGGGHMHTYSNCASALEYYMNSY